MKVRNKVGALIIMAIILAAPSSKIIAQENKPNKQETIDWIVSKLKAYSGTGVYSITKNDKNQISGYSYYFFGGKDQNKSNVYFLLLAENINKDIDWETYIIDFDKISNVTSSSIPSLTEAVFISGTVGFIEAVKYKNRVEDKSSKKAVGNLLLTGKNSAEWGNRTTSLINLDSEPNLKERMIKAFQRLAELNNAAKPKEPF